MGFKPEEVAIGDWAEDLPFPLHTKGPTKGFEWL